jgi:ankyrin repeat protein
LTPERFFDGQMLELGRAIVKGDTAKIEATIRSGADPNSCGREGVTPLVFAWAVGQKKAMVTLLQHGADPNLRITAPEAPPAIRNNSAVTIIAGTPDNEFLEILLDHGGDINAKGSDGEPIVITMLFVAPRNYKGMNLLLERGADMNATDSGGDSLLMNLALLADFEHVYYMLQRRADFRMKDMGGFDISHDVFNYKINKDEFPEGYEWQRKCKEFLLAHGMKDPGPLKPKKQTPEEQAEWLRIYKKALDADLKRHSE